LDVTDLVKLVDLVSRLDMPLEDFDFRNTLPDSGDEELLDALRNKDSTESTDS
jgi:hypothetical protein